MRAAGDVVELAGLRARQHQADPFAGLPLGDPTPKAPDPMLEGSAWVHAMQRVIHDVAQRAGADGFIAVDLRPAAKARGLMTGEESAVVLRQVGVALKLAVRAGAIAPVYRSDGSAVKRSAPRALSARSHGNDLQVYVDGAYVGRPR